jgi:hypothetical protein
MDEAKIRKKESRAYADLAREYIDDGEKNR